MMIIFFLWANYYFGGARGKGGGFEPPSLLDLKGIAHQQINVWSLHTCITLMTSYLFVNNLWLEFAELFATRPIMIHGFPSTEKDWLNKCSLG